MAEQGLEREPPGFDAHASPWPVPAIEGIPFGRDSEEAKAIERILARAAADKARADATSSP